MPPWRSSRKTPSIARIRSASRTPARTAIRDYWTRATSTQEELELRFGEPVVEGSKVVVEWWAVMRDEGAWITLPGALLLRFAADGRCEELREYWHVEDGRREPPPAGAASSPVPDTVPEGPRPGV